MLWINLIMDTFAALALATEHPARNILERQPYSKTESIVTQVMWRNINGHAVFQIGVLITLLFAAEPFGFIDNYQRSCNVKNDQGVCTEFNPFYTTKLYQDQPALDQWNTAINSNPGVGFTAGLIEKYQCLAAKKDGKNVDKQGAEIDCFNSEQVKTLDIAATDYLPQSSGSLGTNTMKLLHFTFVF
jgi:hypothetical protein